MSCSLVKCALPSCRDKCGSVEWFGNLSTCTVRLEYTDKGDGKNDVWHSLGEYSPGQHTELGGGALLLPSTSALRVVEASSGEVISDIGMLGKGLPPLFVDDSNCQKTAASTSVSVVKTRQENTGEKGNLVPWFIAGIVALAVLVAGLLVMQGRKIVPPV